MRLSAIYRSCVCLCVPSKSQGANCTSLTQLSHGGGWCRLQTADPAATSTWTDWGLTYTTAVAHRSTNTAHASPAALEHEGPGRTMMDTTHGSGHARLPRCPQMHDCAKDYTGGFEPPPRPPPPNLPGLKSRLCLSDHTASAEHGASLLCRAYSLAATSQMGVSLTIHLAIRSHVSHAASRTR